jgi:hypothetical protein
MSGMEPRGVQAGNHEHRDRALDRAARLSDQDPCERCETTPAAAK